MKEYELYLFDFDNTLYDTSSGISEILRNALPKLGVEYDDSMFAHYSGMSMDQVYASLTSGDERYAEFTDEFMRIVRSDAYMSGFPFPETEKVLRELKERGKHIGIVSGKMRFKIEKLMERDGLLDLAECIVGFYETERHKPDPEPILKGLEGFDVSREKVLYVGDSINDSEGARNAGLDCAIINRHNGLTPDGLDCTYELDSLGGILDCRSRLLRVQLHQDPVRVLDALLCRLGEPFHGFAVVHPYPT